MKFYLLLLAMVFFTNRANALNPASEHSLRTNGMASFVPVPSDLKLAAENLLEFLQGEKFSPASCAATLEGIYAAAYALETSRFDKNKTVENADSILKNLWEAKLKLRERLGGFREAGTLELECVNGARNVLRAIRFVEDYVGYLKVKPAPAPKDEKLLRKAFSGGFPYLQLNPAQEKLEFRSGDVLLSRGAAYTSAAIARVGDVDGQFSHLAILYIDEKTQKKYVVEAHIEVGAQPATFDAYISDGKARALQFRYPDAELAALAAKKIYNLVSRAHEAGKNIPYDFGMDMKDRSELFCTEIVEYGFAMAAKELGRNFSMPLFQTGMHFKNRDFVNAIGVRVSSTFAPSDIEVDPRFELLAEWRDLSRMPLIHYHDAILEKEFEWMERLDYTFASNLLDALKSNVLFGARRMPLFSSLLKDKFPTNMSQATMRAVGNLHGASSPLFEYLEKADRSMLKKRGLSLTYRELLRAVEKYRAMDLERYRIYQMALRNNRGQTEHGPPSPDLHWYLRPRGE